ncbi:MAG: hypothetical protein ACN23H_01130 [Candidatus Phytoplasma vitis]|nr:MAG: hypothetical protein M6G77_01005 [Candidatus Phytoplasma vitis]
MNNSQNDQINILDIGNYIVEKTREYPCFLKAKNKNERKNPKHGLFIFDNYILSKIIYYIYVTSLLQKQPLFSNEHLFASMYGTIFPKVIENYSMPDDYYVVEGSPNGNSNKLTPENKKMINIIIECISKMKNRKEFIDINRQQRAYFQTRYPLEKMKEKTKNKLEFTEIEFEDMNDPMKKIITDELIIKCFENKKDIFSIDEDCRYECIPKYFNPRTAYYFPKGLKLVSSFKFTEI